MWEIMWAIAQSGMPNRTQPCFLSEMTHEFKGMKGVLGHNNLDNALKWKTKDDAIKHFNELPNWAKGKYEIVKIIFLVTGWHYYQDFYKDIKSEFYKEGEEVMFYVYLDDPYGTELIGYNEDYEAAKRIKEEKDRRWKPGYLWQTRITEIKEKEFSCFD